MKREKGWEKNIGGGSNEGKTEGERERREDRMKGERERRKFQRRNI